MTCLSHAPDVEQFARDHEDILQVVGVGAYEDFDAVQDFLNDTDTTVPILWERSGNLWELNRVRGVSAIQLYSFDLSRQTGFVFLRDSDGIAAFLDAVIQTPWSPVDRVSNS